ncbi:glutamyl-tRNA(Gln) amidotransferase subunit F KNAG_0B01020 [Huiozyma naganishii CBS 8797]|uniref:Glutamyl-tRNA(Gln) amidotransferase subunit F, mitochondrial n=1 Tax=Huiozyma naganishii (strain ATCC MYA-139 / BCRC 22969 / CBS 8797 / KCTC 17520 / NBRC 10181 / NCYC 3082 / Yp74L-3) TaxID=1071383 RepID=J7S379_HUIN7|nr:hypothetical protein KNAG_0B01020 [Kazachstania naganishii CBS 8797]CCK68549.1 hypothetical protein KNAG_0B01020 [Kazachstania naganishii CBS 8797]
MKRFGQLTRLASWRTYSVGSKVGRAFLSISELDTFLSRNEWSVAELFDDRGSDATVSKDVVVSLLKMSGLAQDKCIIPDIQRTLKSQISFISKLQRIELRNQDNLDVKYARVLPRHNKPINFEELLSIIEKENKPQSKTADEISGSWDATGLADSSENGYFVVRKGLIKNRD